ncbi:hypothetical protein QTP86_009946 [Hemibagrus guttatus]|nr:hypothetical protein QTP86_009946 [Hemibagrus guttatus]
MELTQGREKDDQEALKNQTLKTFMTDLKKGSPRVSTSSSARFGTLSHHSFFSRHNPHPHRVRHISGLNGSPVCIVNDDWYSCTPLFPHPLIRSQVTSGATPTSTSVLYHPTYPRADGAKPGAALVSEAWREELKDLATKVSLSAAAPSKRSEHEGWQCCFDYSSPQKAEPGWSRSISGGHLELAQSLCDSGPSEEEPVRRKTQYSSETGRIIPPTSWRTKRHDFHTANTRPGTHGPQTAHLQPGGISLEGQELRVLELLCQILQTDSLSLVQQWLLLAGDREKELVLGMLQQAMCDSSALLQQPQFPIATQPEPPLQTRRKRRMRSSDNTSCIQSQTGSTGFYSDWNTYLRKAPAVQVTQNQFLTLHYSVENWFLTLHYSVQNRFLTLHYSVQNRFLTLHYSVQNRFLTLHYTVQNRFLTLHYTVQNRFLTLHYTVQNRFLTLHYTVQNRFLTLHYTVQNRFLKLELRTL